MLSRARRRQIEEPQVNLTPLVDVVFVILIIFIVLAPLLHLDHVQLTPSSRLREGANLSTKSPLIITLLKDNTIRINQRIVTAATLKAELKALEQQFPKSSHPIIPQLICDKEAPFGTYQLIKDSLELTGFKTLDIVLKPS